MQPKHAPIKIYQPTLLATKNYVALCSASHLEIRRSEIHGLIKHYNKKHQKYLLSFLKLCRFEFLIVPEDT